MDNLQKSAIFLLGLGEEKAASVLRHLEPKHVQALSAALANLKETTKEDVNETFNEFANSAKDQSSFGMNSEAYLKNMLNGALGEEKAAGILDRIEIGDDSHADNLKKLRWMETKTIFSLIETEHPQIIATVLTFLDNEQAAELIPMFSEEMQVDLVMRISNINTISPEALKQLNVILEQEIAYKPTRKVFAKGGSKRVADIINFLDAEVEESLINGVKEKDEELGASIKELMFVFENLLDVDDRGIQNMLRDVSSEDLLLALKGADDAIQEKFFKNMSKRAAELMKDDMETRGPVKLSEVEAAQKEVLAVAQKMAEAGEISLGGKGEEMV